jgi:hypothetical protein
MKCPKCNQEMKVQQEDISHNSKDGKEYDRTVFWCEADDIWGRFEIPRVKLETTNYSL